MIFRLCFILSLFCLPLKEVFAATPKVVVTLAPLHSVVSAVMEGAGQPVLLLQPSVSVHDYYLKPSDMRNLSGADIIFWGGPQLETFMPKALEAANLTEKNIDFLSSPNMALYTVREAHGESDIDPHFWLRPANMLVVAAVTARELSALDPDNSQLYYTNLGNFTNKIRKLALRTKGKISPYLSAPYVVYHDAYLYYEKEFGLSPLGIISADAHHVPGAAHLAKIRNEIRRVGTVCLFSEPQFPESRMNTIKEGMSVETGVLDPLGSNLNPGVNFYEELIDNLTNSFVACFSKLPKK